MTTSPEAPANCWVSPALYPPKITFIIIYTSYDGLDTTKPIPQNLTRATTLTESKPHRMISEIIITEFIYAILIRDQDDTVYLIRYKKKNVPLPNKSILQCLIKNMAKETSTNITFHADVSAAYFIKKINDLTIKKKDFEKILNRPSKDNIDSDEEKFIDYIKQNPDKLSLSPLSRQKRGLYLV